MSYKISLFDTQEQAILSNIDNVFEFLYLWRESKECDNLYIKKFDGKEQSIISSTASCEIMESSKDEPIIIKVLGREIGEMYRY